MQDSWVDAEADMILVGVEKEVILTEVEMDMNHFVAELYVFLTVAEKDIYQIAVEMGIYQTVAVMDIYQIEVVLGICQIVAVIEVVMDVHPSVVRCLLHFQAECQHLHAAEKDVILVVAVSGMIHSLLEVIFVRNLIGVV